MINIKARFVTMPEDLSVSWYNPNKAVILTSENLSNVLKQLRSCKDVELLGEPEATTESGREFQIGASQTMSIVTNYSLLETNGVSSVVPEAGPVKCGPTLGAIPRGLPDGDTIELSVNASMTEFLGYAQTNTTSAYNSAGQKFDLPAVSPQFRVQSATNFAILFDHQTLVFSLKDDPNQTNATAAELGDIKSNTLNRHTLVFVTATILDPTGNRIHEDNSHTNVPPQTTGQ